MIYIRTIIIYPNSFDDLYSTVARTELIFLFLDTSSNDPTRTVRLNPF